MNREPAAIVSTIVAAVTALIALVAAFGLHISNDQQSAILGIVAVLAPLVAGLIIRGKVFAPANVLSRTAKILPVPDAGDTV